MLSDMNNSYRRDFGLIAGLLLTGTPIWCIAECAAVPVKHAKILSAAPGLAVLAAPLSVGAAACAVDATAAVVLALSYMLALVVVDP